MRSTLKQLQGILILKTQTSSQLNSARQSLINFEEGRKNFVGRHESFPMTTHLDMGNQFIYNVKKPVNNDQGANKSYVDQNLAKAGDTMSGILNMGSNKITNVGDATNGSDAININFYKWVPFGSRDQNQNFNCQQRTLYNNYISGNDSEVINVKWAKVRYLPLAGGRMSGNLQMGNNPLTGLSSPNADDQAVNQKYANDDYLKLSGGNMTGVLYLPQNSPVTINQALNYHAA